MTKREEEKLEKEIERAYYRHGNGVSINIMNIPRLFADCKLAVTGGQSIDDAVKAAISKYREN